MITIPLPRKPERLAVAWIPAALYLVAGVWILRYYIQWTSVNFIIGVIALPLIAQPRYGTRSARFGWLALFFALLGFVLSVQTTFYLAITCGLLFVAEQLRGKLSPLVFFTILLMSPVCQYFAHVFSFPIRLWLTGVAGKLLLKAGLDATVTGNMISSGKGDFAVDPACMGLNMLVTSLLCGLLMLAMYQRQFTRSVRVCWPATILLLLFGLNLVANLMRIILLVWFRLLPDDPMHGISGIICLFVYVLLPASFIIRWVVKKKGKVWSQPPSPGTAQAAHLHALHLLILPCLLLAAVKLLHKPAASIAGPLPGIQGYKVSRQKDDIVKLENGRALIYLKPTHGFIYTDHNPILCWTGCGYGFNRVEEQVWQGIPVFTGMLSKGNEQLYTAWWYDNGQVRTTSQVTWRWLMVKGQPSFTIVNITANDRQILMREVAAFAGRKLL